MNNLEHDPEVFHEPVLRTAVFRIARSRGGNGWREYEVPLKRHTVVLDALEWIRAHLDGTLLYRHSCHHGSCGTCGMVINGEHRLACTTSVVELLEAAEAAGRDATIVVEPLPTMKHIADLAVDPAPLFRDFPRAAGYLRESEFNRGSEVPREIERFVRFENCIECGLCVAACPVVRLRDFMAPAALAAYNREITSNPDREEELLPQVDSDRGVWGCERHLECSRVCPTGVYPAKHIVQLQKRIKKRRGT